MGMNKGSGSETLYRYTESGSRNVTGRAVFYAHINMKELLNLFLSLRENA